MTTTARLLAATLASSALLSGCAQIGGAADAVWSGTKSAARFVSSPFRSRLRDAPVQDVQYVGRDAFAGGEVVIFDQSAALPDTVAYGYGSTAAQPARVAEVGRIVEQPQRFRPAFGEGYYGVDDFEGSAPMVAKTPDDDLAFVKLNGESSMADWQTCENLHLGYWRIDAAGGRIDPKFESCMRNKGYVLERELALYGLGSSVPVRAPAPTYRSGYVFP